MSLDRERGFIVIHRRMKSWPLWKAMTCDQRAVWTEMLLAANWAPSQVWVAGQVVEIPRGAFIDTQETIAAEAKVSRKTVRLTVSKLEREGAIKRATVGSEKGHGVTLTTVVNYDRYQSFTEREGQERAEDGATGGASKGPGLGQGWALSNEDQPDQPVSIQPRAAGSADRVVAFSQDAVLSQKYPATTAVLGRLNDADIPMRHAQDNPTRVRGEIVIARVGTDLAVQRATASFRENGRTTIGWHLDAIEGPKVNGAKAPPRTVTAPAAPHEAFQTGEVKL